MSNSTIKKPRVTTEIFISKAIEKHGYKYDYSNSIYIRNNQKIKIRCKEHGVFEQTPNNHLHGGGCTKCSGLYKRTEAELIVDFNAVHNNRYSYDDMGYSRMRNKIKIKCHDHGYFMQLPSAHLRGSGCQKCQGRKTQNEIIKDFVSVHGFRYLYDCVSFESVDKKVKIKCRVHGMFEQTPYHHAKGMGCVMCGYVKQSRTATKNLREFVLLARSKHGDRYDYSGSICKGMQNKINIKCKIHGDFYQNANSHVRGCGCPTCADDVKFGFNRSAYIDMCNKNKDGLSSLYVLRMSNNDEVFYKVGITSIGVKSRFRGLKDYSYEVIHLIVGDGGYIWDLEKTLHRLLKEEKYKPKIFFEGHTECFSKISKGAESLINRLKSTKQIQLVA